MIFEKFIFFEISKLTSQNPGSALIGIFLEPPKSRVAVSTVLNY
jgi:hypothetical protein